MNRLCPKIELSPQPLLHATSNLLTPNSLFKLDHILTYFNFNHFKMGKGKDAAADHGRNTAICGGLTILCALIMIIVAVV